MSDEREVPTTPIAPGVNAPVGIPAPTIGRIVHVWQHGGAKPMAAIVTDVNPNDPMHVNVTVFAPTPAGSKQQPLIGSAMIHPFKLGADVWWSWPERSA